MEFLPDDIINIIISYANPRLSDEMKDCIEEAGTIQSEVYLNPPSMFEYKLRLLGPGVLSSHVFFLEHNKMKYAFYYDLYFTRKALMELLTNYYGDNKIPMVSKLKTKKHIVQRLMSL